MSKEASKAMRRRYKEMWIWPEVLKGHGIDIGAGNDCIDKHTDKFPSILSVRNWDMKDGDAQLMESAADDWYDFVHSSHCLEHMRDPAIAIENWIRILKPDGFLVVTIPEWEMYEKKNWPSRYNGDHKTAWTMERALPGGAQMRSVPLLLENMSDHWGFEIVAMSKIDDDWNPNDMSDQTRPTDGPECAIEFILKKRYPERG